ncbi:uncharacterized protein LOC143691130 [Tamandua tetradactyla]|uniref:uncharacterized protein LOC143691130 n=1 Tax=Tamandua tetradactyla TaxID=48850 RepID=UPI0040541EC7
MRRLGATSLLGIGHSRGAGCALPSTEPSAGAVRPRALGAARGLGPPSLYNMAPGPRHPASGRAGPAAPIILLGLATERSDAPASPFPFLSRSANPLLFRWWVWGPRPTRLCHVCHPPGTHEHLSKIPGGRGRVAAAAPAPSSPGSQCQRRAGDKSSIFLVLPGWQRGLWAGLPLGAGVLRPKPCQPGPRDQWTTGGRPSGGLRGPADRGWRPGTWVAAASQLAGPVPHHPLPPVPSRALGIASASLLLRKLLRPLPPARTRTWLKKVGA